MPTAITQELLSISNTCTEISLCKRKGWSWRRFDWVSETIKFSAKQFRAGVSIDKIIDWKDTRKTTGNNFDSLETFFHAMHIAVTEYGMDDIPYKGFDHLSFREIRNILKEIAAGISTDHIRSKYQLYDPQVFSILASRTQALHKKLVATLRAVANQKDD